MSPDRSLALPFLEPEFLDTYREFVAPSRGEHLVSVDAPGGHADVVVRSTAGIRVAELVGRGLADYMDLRFDDPSGGAAVIDALVQDRRWHAVVLRNVPGASPTLAIAAERARARGWLAWPMPSLVAPYVDTVGDWESFTKTRGDSKARYNRRRATRKLLESGASFEHYTDAHSLQRPLEEAFALYGVRARGVASRWRFSGSGGRRFFRTLAERFAARGMFDLAILRVGPEAVAFAYCLHRADTRYYFQVGITDDPRIARFSPGAALLEHLLARAFEEDCRRFDFMLGDEPYKAVWATGAMPVESFLLARPQLVTRTAFVATRFAASARELARHSTPVRTAIERASRLRSGRTRS